MLLLVLASWFAGRPTTERLDRSELDGLSSEALMEGYQQGDRRCMETLVLRHQHAVYRFVLRSVRRPERAEEITQDTFVRLMKSADRWQPSAKLSTYLLTIARNLCIDDARRQRHVAQPVLDVPVHRDDPGGGTRTAQLADPAHQPALGRISRDQFMARLEAGLAALPPEQREVFLLRHVEGLRFTEIAALSGLSENTVKSRMRYALAALRPWVAEFADATFADEDDDRSA